MHIPAPKMVKCKQLLANMINIKYAHFTMSGRNMYESGS